MTVSRHRLLAIVVFIAISALVIGGLAWVTREALALKHSETMRLALWRLDGRVSSSLAREDNRPVAHFDPLYPPMPAFNSNCSPVTTGTVLVPSPLLNAELPPWMLLHFSIDNRFGWRSPTVVDANLSQRLKRLDPQLDFSNVTPEKKDTLAKLVDSFSTSAFLPIGRTEDSLAAMPQTAQQSPPEQQRSIPQNAQVMQQVDQNDYGRRGSQQSAVRNEAKNSEWASNSALNFLPPGGKYFSEKEAAGASGMMFCTNVRIDAMTPKWVADRFGNEQLFLLRQIHTSELEAVQGVFLDWDKLRTVLLQEIHDLLPNARLEPADASKVDCMSPLPVRLVAEPPSLFTFDSPLRFGLALAWLAALAALLVVGLGGWSLLDLSDRRFRFVTSVTHELRTPLTTLRLYLDMLTSGLIRDQSQREEYLTTLHGESERLNRLVGNVLDFARLERQRPRVVQQSVTVADLMQGLQHDWGNHCKAVGKILVADMANAPDVISSDPELLKQILGNLIDNACKYTRNASDPTIWLRARSLSGSMVFEVEDRGPGVPHNECRSPFRAFARGKHAADVAGGVGLGLALAARWAKLLGGRLELHPPAQSGACFRLILP